MIFINTTIAPVQVSGHRRMLVIVRRRKQPASRLTPSSSSSSAPLLPDYAPRGVHLERQNRTLTGTNASGLVS